MARLLAISTPPCAESRLVGETEPESDPEPEVLVLVGVTRPHPLRRWSTPEFPGFLVPEVIATAAHHQE